MSDAKDPQDRTTPKKGGFGAFSQQYRDRWAAGHPNAKRTREDDAAPPAPAPAESPAESDATTATDAAPEPK